MGTVVSDHPLSYDTRYVLTQHGWQVGDVLGAGAPGVYIGHDPHRMATAQRAGWIVVPSDSAEHAAAAAHGVARAAVGDRFAERAMHHMRFWDPPICTSIRDVPGHAHYRMPYLDPTWFGDGINSFVQAMLDMRHERLSDADVRRAVQRYGAKYATRLSKDYLPVHWWELPEGEIPLPMMQFALAYELDEAGVDDVDEDTFRRAAQRLRLSPEWSVREFGLLNELAEKRARK